MKKMGTALRFVIVFLLLLALPVCAGAFTCYPDVNSTTGVEVNVSPDEDGMYMIPELPSQITAPAGKVFYAWMVNPGYETEDILYPGDLLNVDYLFLYALWRDENAATYTLSVAPNGSTGPSYESSTLYAGTTVFLPSYSSYLLPPPDGKQFKAWEIDGKEYAPHARIDNVSGNLQLKPVWVDSSVELITVKFSRGEAKSGKMEDMVVANGTEYTLPQPSAYTPYEHSWFSGWKVGTDENLHQPGEEVTLSYSYHTMYITARWEYADQITVYYNTGATSEWMPPTELYSDTNSEFSLPECKLEYPNYSFAGWQIDGEEPAQTYQAGEKFTFKELSDFAGEWGSLSLIAVWDPDDHTVSFDANTGEGTMTAVNVEYGEEYELPTCTFTAPEAGREFLGWSVDDPNATPQAAGSILKITGDHTLYARWKDATPSYTVTLDLNGKTTADGESTIVLGSDYETGDVVNPPYDLSRYGVNHKAGIYRWLLDDEYCYSVVIENQDVVLKAMWADYTLTFDYNGGSELGKLSSSMPMMAGEGYVLPGTEGEYVWDIEPPEATPDYILVGWECDGKTYAIGDTITVTKDMTVKAIWAPEAGEEYTITYHAGDHGAGASWSETVEASEDGFVLPGRSEGFGAAEMKYEFIGWKVNGGDYNDAEFILSEGEPRITLTANVTATALWKVKMVSVAYRSEGEVKHAPEQEYGSWHTLLTYDKIGFTKPANKEFVEWVQVFDKPEGQIYKDELEPGMDIMATGSDIIEAVWTASATDYTITIVNTTGGTINGLLVFDEEKLDSYFKVPPKEMISADEGYEFDRFEVKGDAYDTTLTLEAGGLFKVKGDATVTAIWKSVGADPEPEPETYTLTIDANEGTFTGTAPTAKAGEKFTLPAASTITREGYTFAGWKVGNTMYEAGALVDAAAEMEAVAQWTANTYTVTFDKNASDANGSMEEQTFAHDVEQALTANDFERSGYTFTGWNTQADGSGTAYSDEQSTKFSADTTLYAQWTINTYKITFDKNAADATGEMSEQTFTYNVIQPITAVDFQRPGYVFMGWNTQPNGSGDAYADGASTTFTQDTVLYAQWSADGSVTYKLILDMGDETIDYRTGVPYGGQVNLPHPIMQDVYVPATGIFSHWTVGNDGVEYGPGSPFTMGTSDITAVAVWDPGVVVMFTPGEGTFVGSSGHKYEELTPEMAAGFTMPTGEEAEEFYKIVAPEGKELVGWTINNGTQVYAPYTSYVPQNAVTLTAMWKTIEYQVTFDANGGKGTMNTQTFVYNTADTLTANAFTRDGYYFVGWNTAANGSGTTYTNVQSIMPSADMTLYAQWSSIPQYTISYNAGEGTGSMSAQTVYENTEYVLLQNGFTAPVGHHFAGWLVKDVTKQPGDKITVSESVTVTAQWALDEHKVILSDGDNATVELTKNYGDTYTLPEITDTVFVVPSGKVLDCWMMGDVEKFPGDKITVTGDVTLTANWAKSMLTITFEGGDYRTDAEGNPEKAPSVDWPHGQPYELPEDSKGYIAKLGEQFAFWSLDGETEYENQTISKVRRDMTFIAVWEEAIDTDTVLLSDAAVTDALEAAGIKDADDIVEKMAEEVSALQSQGYTEENVAHMDVKVQVYDATANSGAGGYVDANAEIMKEMVAQQGGIVVPIEIPEEAPQGEAAKNYEFRVLHMISEEGMDKAVGTVEELTPQGIEGNKLLVKFTSLSPVTIVWKEVVPQAVVEALPSTGDPSSLLGWITLLGASGLGMKAIKRKKK